MNRRKFLKIILGVSFIPFSVRSEAVNQQKEINLAASHNWYIEPAEYDLFLPDKHPFVNLFFEDVDSAMDMISTHVGQGRDHWDQDIMTSLIPVSYNVLPPLDENTMKVVIRYKMKVSSHLSYQDQLYYIRSTTEKVSGIPMQYVP